jgi:DNA-binding protein HU-beta
MTRQNFKITLAEATQTDKKTAGVFLDTLSALAYKEIKKNGEFVLPGFGKLVKAEEEGAQTQQKIKIPTKTVVKFRVAKAAKDAVFGGKEVVKELYPGEPKRLVLRRPITGSHLHSPYKAEAARYELSIFCASVLRLQ